MVTTPSINREAQQAIHDFINFLPTIDQVNRNSFDKAFHEQLEHIDNLTSKVPDKRQELMQYCFESCGEELDQSTPYKRMRYKPQGYAGDYLTIDLLYTRNVSSPGRGRLWDDFVLDIPGARAVRDRKRFFIELFSGLCEQAGRGISVLNLASGSCRDMAEAITQTGSLAKGSYLHCVDSDPQAIAYAKSVVQPLRHVSFFWETRNALRIRPIRKFDLVWSAGLFDYLPDPAAIALLERMWLFTRPGGTLIVGNAHPQNVSRAHVEWCTAWFLIHRSEAELLTLCHKAGIPEGAVRFEQEREGVFVFCIAQKP